MIYDEFAQGFDEITLQSIKYGMTGFVFLQLCGVQLFDCVVADIPIHVRAVMERRNHSNQNCIWQLVSAYLMRSYASSSLIVDSCIVLV